MPAFGSCRFASGGERRLAERLQQKLEDDYLLWYDVPVGPSNAHPDFVILHPRRGILILEVKHWQLETIRKADRQSFELLTARGLIHESNPLEQARQYAHVVADKLKTDSELTFSSGHQKGKLLFPWSYGVALTNITRSQFDGTDLRDVIESHRVICKDEMLETAEAEDFQRRLWNMFSIKFEAALTLPQIDRIRWHMFPEIRIPPRTAALFTDTETDEATTASLPDLMQVMDLQQEQLARSLGDGHRVIHGVAGSGKTLILGYRAVQLAKVCTKPILILCYNRKLAERLGQWMRDKGLAEKVLVHSFHQWCRAQLIAYQAGLPEGLEGDAFFAELVSRVMRAVDQGQIPGGQYDALLIDEGHDFRPEWFKLVMQMVDPESNSLLVLYDDAQSIYQQTAKHKFSFKSVGIQAQGRTTVFRINYRNTQEILRVAATFAHDLLTPQEADEDHVPTLRPVSVGRSGPAPLLIQLPSLKNESSRIAAHLKEVHDRGTCWRDMAVLYRYRAPVGETLAHTLRQAGVPITWQEDVNFSPTQDTVKLMSMHASKGLEYPVVILAGLGLIDAADLAEAEGEARILYVAMTRATRELVMTCDRETAITRRLAAATSSL
jgi:hypothetical protein